MNPWTLFKDQQNQFLKPAGDYDFKIPLQTKQRSHGATKLATRTWERLVFEGTEEQAPPILPMGRLSAEILFLSTKPVGDLSNCIKILEDALNRRAYQDDRQIDHINALRYYGPEIGNDRILLRLKEKG